MAESTATSGPYPALIAGEARVQAENRLRRQVWGYVLAAVAVWSLLLVISLWWNIHRQNDLAMELARNTARSAFNKDVAYRAWASSHGGVYVEPTEKTPPSPWMAHLPDRDLVTTEGRALTLMNPAYMLREMMQDFGDLYGIKGRIVGTVALNPNNEADPWETDAIHAFEQGRADEVLAVSDVDGKPHLRLVKPFVMEQSCQKCHGHLGFKNGEVRGAVGVAVPLEPYLEASRDAVQALAASHGGLWILGMGGIVFLGRRSEGRLKDKARADEENRLAAHVFRNAMEATIITDPAARILRVNPMFTQLTGYTAEEALGRKPSLLRSEHHDDAFYSALWTTILTEGHWQGEIWNRRKDGSVFAAWESIVAVRDEAGAVRYYIGSFSDITEQVEARRHIMHLAHYDVLTGLPNRVLFQDRLERAVVHARRHDRLVALLFLDLDGFKKVNDSMGHRAGDELLKQVAQRLKRCVRVSDTIARLGGDEFTVILEEIASPTDATIVADKILSEVAAPVEIEGRPVVVGTSIGIALFPEHGKDGDALLKHADTAMYQAKGAGKGRHNLYVEEMTTRQERHLALETALRLAVDAGEIDVAFQPKADLASGRITGFEALARWTHPELGIIPPSDFIPLAEEMRLIERIDMLVLRKACHQVRHWRDAGFDVNLAANLSGLGIRDEALVRHVALILSDYGLPASSLELEITESVAIAADSSQRMALAALREMGIGLAIDDFGTGYSSLGALKKLPLTTLKIDRTFVMDLARDSRDMLLVSSIVGLGHSLGFKAVAEGVEQPEQRDLLAALECDLYQGYYLAPPLAVDAATRFLARERAACAPSLQSHDA